jgi:hypothetical protein
LKGTYFFLYQTGKNYILTDNNQSYNSFDYGYMSNAVHANLPYDKVKKTPVGDIKTSVLEAKHSSYFNKTNCVTEPYLLSRYGVHGTAIKSMIKDSPNNEIKFLMEKKSGKEDNLYS